MTTLTPDRVPEGWDSASEWYDRIIAPNTARYAEDALRIASPQPDERVLDVAAGTGAFALLAAKQRAQVVATDFAPLMIRRLEAKAAGMGLTGIETRVMDGQNLDLPDASFDVAASVFGLIFFPDRVKGLREMHRVLRPGGRAVLATWSAPPRVRVVSIVADAVREALPHVPPPKEPPAIFSHADPKRIEGEALEAGFKTVDITTVTHTWVLPTPESVWTDLAPTSPVFKTLLEGLDDRSRSLVRDAVIAHATRAVRGGRVELPSEAHIVRLGK